MYFQLFLIRLQLDRIERQNRDMLALLVEEQVDEAAIARMRARLRGTRHRLQRAITQNT